MSINSYEVNRILSASPAELIRILYEAALRSVSEARAHLLGGDIAGRARQITKAQMIVVELANSVDCEKGGDVARRLVALYDYVLNRLVEAHVEQRDAPLEEVEKLLTTLQEGWVNIEVALPAEPAQAVG